MFFSHVISAEEIALKTELDRTTLGTPSSSSTSVELAQAGTEAPPVPPVDIPGGVDIVEIDPPAQVDVPGGVGIVEIDPPAQADVPGGVGIGEINPPAQVDDNGGISVQANIGVNDER